jgi:hypothetical protein
MAQIEHDGGRDGDGSLSAIKTYLDRVRELAPTEVTAAFLAINSSIPLDSTYLNYLIAFFCFLVLACWLYLRRFQGITNLQQLAFTTFVAFPVWAFNISVARFDFVADKTFIPASVLILTTLFAPFFAGPRH